MKYKEITVAAWPKGKVTFSTDHPSYRPLKRAAAKLKRLFEALEKAHEAYEALPFEFGRWKQAPEKEAAREKYNALAAEYKRVASEAAHKLLLAQPEHDQHGVASELWKEQGELGLAILHAFISRNLLPTTAYLGGSNPPKWTHPRAGEMQARAEAIKAKSAATREAKRQDEQLSHAAWSAAERMWALQLNSLQVGDVVAVAGWDYRLSFAGIVESVSPDGWVSLREYPYNGQSRYSAERLIKVDTSLAEAPATVTCNNCGKEHPVAEQYECCALPPHRFSETPLGSKLYACVDAMSEQRRRERQQAQKVAA